MNLTDYDKEQIALIKKWEQKEPGVIDMALGVVMDPIAKIFNKIVPNKVIENALTGANAVAQFLTDADDVKRDGKVNQIKELREKDLQLCDSLANTVHNWAVGIALIEGGAVGVGGIAGLAADVPAIIILALRTIHKIGLCYGYEVNASNEEAEKAYALSILAAANANSMQEKAGALIALQKLNVMVQKNALKKITEMAAAKNPLAKGFLGVKEVAKMLNINLTKRKTAQIVPILGAGIGAAMNSTFINDIAWAARRSFQKRHLADNQLINIEN